MEGEMNKRIQSRQQGITFVGLLFTAALVAVVAVVGLQVVPSMIEFQAVQKAVNKAAAVSDPAEAKAAFDRVASVDDIRSIAGKDLTIKQENGKLVISFDYQREIHLFGPAYLTMKYSGRSN